MKNFTMILAFLMIGISGMAQTRDKQWGFGLGAGAYQNTEIEAIGFMPQFSLNHYLSPSFDLGFQSEWGLFNEEIVSNIDLADFSFNLKYKFNNGYLLKENSLIQPYIYAGPAYLFDNRKEALDIHGGVGAKVALSPKISLFAEAGYIDGLDVETPVGATKDSHLKATVGLVFNFSVPKDSDFDGVPDSKDQCPNTPDLVKVDKHGCPVDSDGDAVPDYIDDCPQIPGLIALKGCPDRDGDGIRDSDDECPDVYGLEKFKGCPDSDNDGVTDAMDKCPDTPELWKVDKHGCPVDSDGDGLYDEEDECPDKPGTIENKGCPAPEPEPVPQAFENFNPVLFDTDLSRLRSEEKAKLDGLVKALKMYPEYTFKIFGHADERASEKYNMELSIERANSVANYFKKNGIAPERIMEIKGFGETRPAVPNTTPENMQKNRRVELSFEEKK